MKCMRGIDAPSSQISSTIVMETGTGRVETGISKGLYARQNTIPSWYQAESNALTTSAIIGIVVVGVAMLVLAFLIYWYAFRKNMRWQKGWWVGWLWPE